VNDLLKAGDVNAKRARKDWYMHQVLNQKVSILV